MNSKSVWTAAGVSTLGLGAITLAAGSLLAPPRAPTDAMNPEKLGGPQKAQIEMIQSMDTRRVDVNGDGADDIISTSGGFGDPVELMMTDGRTARQTPLTFGTQRPIVGIADIKSFAAGDQRLLAVVGSEGAGFGDDEGVWTLAVVSDGEPVWSMELNAPSEDESVKNDCDAGMDIGDLNGDGKPELVVAYRLVTMRDQGGGMFMGAGGTTHVAVFDAATGERLAQRESSVGMNPQVIVSPQRGDRPGTILVLGMGDAERFTWR